MRPGDKVVLNSLANCTCARPECICDGEPVTEYGVVVHVYEDLDGTRCKVAFFGTDGFPEGKLEENPYILDYATSSLTPFPRRD